MSDGIKGAVADVSEAVAKPVIDEVGKSLEQGVQAVFSGPPKVQDPQASQKKQAEDQKKTQEVIWRVEQLKKTETEIQKVSQQKQQQQSAQQQQEQEDRKVKQFKIVEQQNKQQDLTHAQLQERAAEIKRGVGG